MKCHSCKTEARLERATKIGTRRYAEYVCRNKRCENHGKTVVATLGKGSAPAADAAGGSLNEGRTGAVPDAEAAPIIHHFEGKEDEQE